MSARVPTAIGSRGLVCSGAPGRVGPSWLIHEALKLNSRLLD